MTRPSTDVINVKESRKMSTEILKRLVRSACIPLVVLCAPPAIAHDSWVDDHVAAAYDYVLGKGPAAGRGALIAASTDPGRSGPRLVAPKVIG